MPKLRREVRIPIYFLVVGVAVMLVSPLASIFAAVKIADNNATRLQDQYVADRNRIAAASLVTLCKSFTAMIDAYNEIPRTASSTKIQSAWISLYTISQCQPPRTK